MKIRLRRLAQGGGGVGSDGTYETCVVEHGDHYDLPAGAEKVAPQTQLHDWQTEKPTSVKKEEGA